MNGSCSLCGSRPMDGSCSLYGSRSLYRQYKYNTVQGSGSVQGTGSVHGSGSAQGTGPVHGSGQYMFLVRIQILVLYRYLSRLNADTGTFLLLSTEGTTATDQRRGSKVTDPDPYGVWPRHQLVHIIFLSWSRGRKGSKIMLLGNGFLHAIDTSMYRYIRYGTVSINKGTMVFI
jgi:hypothetical protein